MEFKERIQILRKEKNMGLTKLAGEFDKSESAIRMWESGKSKPDADTLIKLAKYFNCSTDYLLGLSDHRNIESTFFKEEKYVALNEALSKAGKEESFMKNLTVLFANLIEISDYAKDKGKFLYDFAEIIENLFIYFGRSAKATMAVIKLTNRSALNDLRFSKYGHRLEAEYGYCTLTLNDFYTRLMNCTIQEIGKLHLSTVNNISDIVYHIADLFHRSKITGDAKYLWPEDNYWEDFDDAP